jgi:hypothetical protein
MWFSETKPRLSQEGIVVRIGTLGSWFSLVLSVPLASSLEKTLPLRAEELEFESWHGYFPLVSPLV